MHRALVAMCRLLPKWVPYSAMAVVTLGYLAVGGKQRRCIYSYFRKRHGYSPVKAALNVYLNYLAFGTAVLDRFMLYAGKKFSLELHGYSYYQELNNAPGGFMILSSHCGNFEMAGYKLTSEGKQFNVVAFGGEAPNVIQNRARILSQHNISQILTAPDMRHLFEINNALADNNVVAMAADRSLGSNKTINVPVLGADAPLPAGPFKIVAARKIPALAVFVNKKGYSKYIVQIVPLADYTSPVNLATKFGNALSNIASNYPRQWFNFFPFWIYDKNSTK